MLLGHPTNDPLNSVQTVLSIADGKVQYYSADATAAMLRRNSIADLDIRTIHCHAA